jgi:hypothetical protein
MLGQVFSSALSWIFDIQNTFIRASELGDTTQVNAFLQRSKAEQVLLENKAGQINFFSASFSTNNIISTKTMGSALLRAAKNQHLDTTATLFQACIMNNISTDDLLRTYHELLDTNVSEDILKIFIQSDWINTISKKSLHRISMHPNAEHPSLRSLLDTLPNIQSRTMTVITAVPYGSFGDPSAGCKLIGNMQTNYPNIRFKWLVIPIESPNFILENYTDRLNSDTLETYKLTKTDEILNHHELLSISDLIVSFPTHHWITNQHQFLYGLGVPVISVMEYDSNIYDEVKRKTPFEPAINGPIVLQTGLNSKALGIFLSNSKPPSRAELIDRLEQIKNNGSHPDSAKLNILFGKNSANEYLSSNNYYFGYFNKEDHSVHPRCKVNPTEFMMAAIHKARTINPDIKQIDFMIRSENIQHLQLLLNKLHSKHINAKVCFYNDDTYSEISNLESSSESSFNLTIRVINPFPTKPETFQALQILSDPFCALTGDQSFSEGLDKIFFYQAMRWKMRLFESFLDIVKACCGNNSELYLFYAMQINRTEKSLDVLFETLINAYHEAGGNVQSFFEDLQTQANIVSNYVKTNKDLEQTLPQILNDIMYNPVETICHNHNHFIDMPHDLMLASLYYPDQSIHLYRRFMETDNASSLLSEHNSEQLRLLRLSCQVEEPNPAKRKRCNLEEIEAPATTKKSKVKARKDA